MSQPSAGRLRLDIALDALGWLLFGVALAQRFSQLELASPYDTGILLTHTFLMREGAVPYRDFYSNYPPGIFHLVSLAWTLLGVSATTLHVLGAAVHVAISLLAGRLAGRACARRFVPLASGFVLLWLTPLWLTPYAWLVAVAMALLAVELLLGALSAPERRWPWLASGAALGLVGDFRHDLFVYLVALLIGVSVVARARGRWPRVGLGLIVVGAMASLLPVWIPVIARAGLAQPLNDLVIEQARYVQPARVLPAPALFALMPLGPVVVPALLVSQLSAAFALLLLAPVLSRVRPAADSDAARRAMLLLGVTALAMVPHALGRTDIFHCLFGVAPGLALVAVVVHRLGGGAALQRVLVPISLVAVLLPARDLLVQIRGRDWRQLSTRSRFSGWPPSPERERAVAFVHQHCPPGQPIFVGNLQHQRLIFNDVSFYYFAERRGATRRLQFDPNVETREDIQAEMIAELERTRPPVAVLFAAPFVEEANLSRRPGARLLDDYIAAHFAPVEWAGPWLLFLRRPGNETS